MLVELVKLKMTYDEDPESEIQILKDVEKLNIDIPSNKEIVRQFYKEIIKTKMLKQEQLDENEEAEKLVNDLQNNKSFEEKPEVKKSQHRHKSTATTSLEVRKKDRKYLEGIPL